MTPSNRDGLREPSFKMSSAQLAVVVVLGSLSVLFGAGIVAYLVTRYTSPRWRLPETPDLPVGLFASTVLILATSVALHVALKAIKKNQLSLVLRSLRLSGLFALAFLIGQFINWYDMAELQHGTPALYVFTFYMVTALHALHVIGGLIPLGIVTAKAGRQEYSSSRWEGLKLCAQYWDFLAIVWLVILILLFAFD